MFQFAWSCMDYGYFGHWIAKQRKRLVAVNLAGVGRFLGIWGVSAKLPFPGRFGGKQSAGLAGWSQPCGRLMYSKGSEFPFEQTSLAIQGHGWVGGFRGFCLTMYY